MNQFQYIQYLEAVLSQYKRPCKVTAIRNAPQCVRFKLSPLRRKLARDGDDEATGDMTRISHLNTLCPDIAAQLGVSSVLVSQNGGIWLEIAKASADTVYANAFPVQTGGRVTLGLDVAGSPVELDLADPRHTHILISGTTGSGKSVLLDAIIYSLCRNPIDLRVIVIDPHNTMGRWGTALGIEEIVTTPAQALATLRLVAGLVQHRLFNSTHSSTRYVVVIDEFAKLLQSSHGKEIEEVLIHLLAEARKVRVNIIAATQYPGHKICASVMKVNFPVRIGMAMMSNKDSWVALGQGGAEQLNGMGDGLLRVGMKARRFQGAWVEDGDVRGVMQKPTPRKMVVPVKKVGKGVPTLWERVRRGLGI